ncbi:hypothetical protein [Flavobacterium subsaxonicum]|uniref:VWA domain-containing protein n=1 Tax=Flavobacterium subsaxonicum WB 4.1-42 = DSM 21790 TaxID=1121898 RepID=A0A0A2MSA5_9FLAO|nr:hypothetical protein [Flavobacterium subsaxonicum]KGO95189.1 hypothetical protein Q766_03590 [Flavobacterium subsaxonicum WB 4.1-42 = DSM 21790]
MTASTVLLLLLSAIAALALSFYQYLFKAKKKSKVFFFLAFLRFVTLFSIFILLINPIVTRKDLETVKTPLPILVDNSLSIKELGQDSIAKIIEAKIAGNSALKDKYDVQTYTFSDGFEAGKVPDFTGRQTHIDQAAQNLKQLYRNTNYPVVILTDGNQTIGNDYVYSFQENTAVYPVVLGDTTSVLDLKVNQVNVNKYAFLKNKFPVEVFLQYSGNKSVNAVFSVMQGNAVLYKQNVAFSKDKKAQSVSLLLDAAKVGVQTYKAVLSSSEPEKNKYNNIKNFAVEVIDQRSEVAIVSAITHPDLGALKRAIETNQQRKVTILKPSEVKSLQDYNVLILYQPDASFKMLLEQNKNAGLNTFIITGLNTDFNLLNQYQSSIDFKMTSQSEDYLADFNSQFNLFAPQDIGFSQFPPLTHPFGTITVKGSVNTLLQSRIRNVQTGSPLMVFSETGPARSAYLFGENIWKWRVESHLNTKSFEQFDVFIDKTIQFLASNSKRKSLVVNHESFYNSGEVIGITAQYFNKNYEFDENARLTIQLKNKKNNTTKTFDFLKGNAEYKVNLDGLAAGQYSFTVKESTSGTSYAGSFEVLDFEIEKQFVNPDLARLQQTAANTNGAVYYSNTADKLIKFLSENENYKALQKEITKKSPLIDWMWLLVIVAITLSAEWFIRKYNGLL